MQLIIFLLSDGDLLLMFYCIPYCSSLLDSRLRRGNQVINTNNNITPQTASLRYL